MLFEDEPIEEIENLLKRNGNIYLDDPERGIDLIKKMMLRRQEKKIRFKVDDLINNQIFPIL